MEQMTINLVNPWSIQNGRAVCPAVLIVEGVYCGSRDCIFWPSSVLQKAAKSWQGIPVTLGHPTVNGQPVSVHRSDAENRKVFGRFDQPCSHPVVYFLEQWKN